MNLTINGISVTPSPGESLYDITRRLGFFNGKLSSDPLAAKIIGKTFTLNYIPLREKDVDIDRESMRRAIAASGGVVQLLGYKDALGKEVYKRTAQFIIFLAIKKCWPNAEAQMSFTVGSGLYIKVSGAEDFSVITLKEEIQRIVNEDIKLIRRRLKTDEAIDYFIATGEDDKARLLSYREYDYLDVYQYGEYIDYFYGEMAPSTGFLKVWDIMPMDEGFIFIFPDASDPDRVSRYRHMPNFMHVYSEGKRWGELMECETVADLNELVISGEIRELIRVF